jgi:hypothetical protein
MWGVFNAAAFDPRFGLGASVAVKLFAATQLSRLTVLSAKHMAEGKPLFSAATESRNLVSQLHASLTLKKETHL